MIENENIGYSKTLDNLEIAASHSLSSACKMLQDMDKNYYKGFKNWVKTHSDEGTQFIDDYEKGRIGVNRSHIFWEQ